MHLSDLSCTACQHLVHSAALKRLAQEAEAAARSGHLTEALTLWRQALDLLPERARQYQAIQAKIVELSELLRTSGSAGNPADAAKKKSNMGALGALGAALLFLITKGKFLLLGLSKASTFFSMLLAFGVYWTVWGWQFAAGFVICIYIHEMGHVAALRHFGIPATAPMFLPGIGAIVRIKQYPATPSEDAYVGLAGPVWGLAAALATYGIYLYTGNPLFAALTHLGALINVFNLMPIASLDGDRGFRAFNQPQRWAATLALGAAWYFTHEGLLLLLIVVAAGKTMFGKPAAKPDSAALTKYIILLAALMALSTTTEKIASAATAPLAVPPATQPVPAP